MRWSLSSASLDIVSFPGVSPTQPIGREEAAGNSGSALIPSAAHFRGGGLGFLELVSEQFFGEEVLQGCIPAGDATACGQAMQQAATGRQQDWKEVKQKHANSSALCACSMGGFSSADWSASCHMLAMPLPVRSGRGKNLPAV